MTGKYAFRAACALLTVVAAAGLTAATRTHDVAAVATDQEVTVRDGVAHATFRISLTNNESSDITHVFVHFKDGSSVSLGDVAAGKSAASDPQTKAIDLADEPSRHVPLKATLTYVRDGAEVSTDAVFIIRVERE